METDEKEAPLISYGEKETKKMVSSLDLYKSSSSAGSSAKKSLDLKRTEDRLLTMMRELMHHSVEFDRRGKRDHATAKKVVYSRIEKYIRHFFDRLLEAFQHANTNKDQVLVAQAELRKLAKNLKQNEQWTWSAKEVGRELGKKLNLSLQQLDSRTDMMKENRDAYTRKLIQIRDLVLNHGVHPDHVVIKHKSPSLGNLPTMSRFSSIDEMIEQSQLDQISHTQSDEERIKQKYGPNIFNAYKKIDDHCWELIVSSRRSIDRKLDMYEAKFEKQLRSMFRLKKLVETLSDKYKEVRDANEVLVNAQDGGAQNLNVQISRLPPAMRMHIVQQIQHGLQMAKGGKAVGQDSNNLVPVSRSRGRRNSMVGLANGKWSGARRAGMYINMKTQGGAFKSFDIDELIELRKTQDAAMKEFLMRAKMRGSRNVASGLPHFNNNRKSFNKWFAKAVRKHTGIWTQGDESDDSDGEKDEEGSHEAGKDSDDPEDKDVEGEETDKKDGESGEEEEGGENEEDEDKADEEEDVSEEGTASPKKKKKKKKKKGSSLRASVKRGSMMGRVMGWLLKFNSSPLQHTMKDLEKSSKLNRFIKVLGPMFHAQGDDLRTRPLAVPEYMFSRQSEQHVLGYRGVAGVAVSLAGSIDQWQKLEGTGEDISHELDRRGVKLATVAKKFLKTGKGKTRRGSLTLRLSGGIDKRSSARSSGSSASGSRRSTRERSSSRQRGRSRRRTGSDHDLSPDGDRTSRRSALQRRQTRSPVRNPSRTVESDGSIRHGVTIAVSGVTEDGDAQAGKGRRRKLRGKMQTQGARRSRQGRMSFSRKFQSTGTLRGGSSSFGRRRFHDQHGNQYGGLEGDGLEEAGSMEPHERKLFLRHKIHLMQEELIMLGHATGDHDTPSQLSPRHSSIGRPGAAPYPVFATLPDNIHNKLFNSHTQTHQQAHVHASRQRQAYRQSSGYILRPSLFDRSDDDRGDGASVVEFPVFGEGAGEEAETELQGQGADGQEVGSATDDGTENDSEDEETEAESKTACSSDVDDMHKHHRRDDDDDSDCGHRGGGRGGSGRRWSSQRTDQGSQQPSSGTSDQPSSSASTSSPSDGLIEDSSTTDAVEGGRKKAGERSSTVMVSGKVLLLEEDAERHREIERQIEMLYRKRDKAAFTDGGGLRDKTVEELLLELELERTARSQLKEEVERREGEERQKLLQDIAAQLRAHKQHGLRGSDSEEDTAEDLHSDRDREEEEDEQQSIEEGLIDDFTFHLNNPNFSNQPNISDPSFFPSTPVPGAESAVAELRTQRKESQIKEGKRKKGKKKKKATSSKSRSSRVRSKSVSDRARPGGRSPSQRQGLGRGHRHSAHGVVPGTSDDSDQPSGPSATSSSASIQQESKIRNSGLSHIIDEAAADLNAASAAIVGDTAVIEVKEIDNYIDLDSEDEDTGEQAGEAATEAKGSKDGWSKEKDGMKLEQYHMSLSTDASSLPSSSSYPPSTTAATATMNKKKSRRKKSKKASSPIASLLPSPQQTKKMRQGSSLMKKLYKKTVPSAPSVVSVGVSGSKRKSKTKGIAGSQRRSSKKHVSEKPTVQKTKARGGEERQKAENPRASQPGSQMQFLSVEGFPDSQRSSTERHHKRRPSVQMTVADYMKVKEKQERQQANDQSPIKILTSALRSKAEAKFSQADSATTISMSLSSDDAEAEEEGEGDDTEDPPRREGPSTDAGEEEDKITADPNAFHFASTYTAREGELSVAEAAMMRDFPLFGEQGHLPHTGRSTQIFTNIVNHHHHYHVHPSMMMLVDDFASEYGAMYPNNDDYYASALSHILDSPLMSNFDGDIGMRFGVHGADSRHDVRDGDDASIDAAVGRSWSFEEKRVVAVPVPPSHLSNSLSQGEDPLSSGTTSTPHLPAIVPEVNLSMLAPVYFQHTTAIGQIDHRHPDLSTPASSVSMPHPPISTVGAGPYSRHTSIGSVKKRSSCVQSLPTASSRSALGSYTSVMSQVIAVAQREAEQTRATPRVTEEVKNTEGKNDTAARVKIARKPPLKKQRKKKKRGKKKKPNFKIIARTREEPKEVEVLNNGVTLVLEQGTDSFNNTDGVESHRVTKVFVGGKGKKKAGKGAKSARTIREGSKSGDRLKLRAQERQTDRAETYTRATGQATARAAYTIKVGESENKTDDDALAVPTFSVEVLRPGGAQDTKQGSPALSDDKGEEGVERKVKMDKNQAPGGDRHTSVKNRSRTGKLSNGTIVTNDRKEAALERKKAGRKKHKESKVSPSQPGFTHKTRHMAFVRGEQARFIAHHHRNPILYPGLVNKQQKALINQLSLAFPPSTPSLRFTASYHSTHTDSSGSRPGSRTGHKRISHPQSLVLQRQQLARLYPQSNSALVSSTVSASLPFAPGFYSGHGKAGTGGANANAANTHNIPPASEVLSRRGHRSSCFLLDQTAHTSGSTHETKSNNTKTRRDEEVNIPTNADSVPHSSKEHEMSRDISGTSNISNIESSSPGEGGYQHFTLGDLLREVGLWPPPANLDLPLARPQTSQFDDFFSPPHPSSSASSSTSDATTASSPVIGGGSTTAHSVHLGEGRKGKNDDTTEASIVLAGKGGQDGETRDFRTMPSGPSSGPIPPSSSRQRKKGAEGKSKRKQL